MTEEHRINIMFDESDIQMPQQNDTPKIAGLMERFVALLIDWGMICILYQIVLLVVFRWLQPDLEQIYWLIAGVAVPFVLYETIFSCGGRVTLGKKLVGVRVVDKTTAEPLDLLRAFMRAIGYLVSALILMCGFLLAFIDSEHRALQDYLAGSIVIEARPKSWLEKTMLTLVGLILLTLFCSYFYKQVFGTGSLSQQRLISKARAHVENIGYLEEVHRFKFGYYTNDLLRLSILSGDPVQFQRDTHKVLDRKDFRIGVGPKGYKIKARAKDVRKTPVYYPAF